MKNMLAQAGKVLAVLAIVVLGYVFVQNYLFDRYDMLQDVNMDRELANKGVCEKMQKYSLKSVSFHKTTKYEIIYADGKEASGMLDVMGAITFRNIDPDQEFFRVVLDDKGCQTEFLELYMKYDIAESADFISNDFNRVVEKITEG